MNKAFGSEAENLLVCDRTNNLIHSVQAQSVSQPHNKI